MANIKSQIKRNKTNDKAHERNKAVKSELRTEVRRTREAIAAGDKAAAEKSLAQATKKLDKAVSKGVIHAEPGREPQVGHRQAGRGALSSVLIVTPKARPVWGGLSSLPALRYGAARLLRNRRALWSR